MYIGEQLINPTDDRLRLSAQLGCKGIVIDSRPNRDVCNSDGSWDAERVAASRARIEGFGMKLEGMALTSARCCATACGSRTRRRRQWRGCARTFSPR